MAESILAARGSWPELTDWNVRRQGLRLIEDGCDLDPRHQETVHAAMVVCVVDGTQQLSGLLAEAPIRIRVEA